MVNGKPHRSKHAIQSQNVFRHLVRWAEAIGMKVNTAKTGMLCISDAMQCTADASILNADQNQLGCQDSFKALGMIFGRRPNFDLHVEKTRKAIRR